MALTVEKDSNQSLTAEDFEQFPPEDLQLLDQLWTHHSGGKLGFKIQSKIWQACGQPKTYSSKWEEFGHRIGWFKQDQWLKYTEHSFTQNYCAGALPRFIYGKSGVRLAYGKVASIAQACLSKTHLSQ